MLTIRERVDFAELVLRDLEARTAAAEKVKEHAMRQLFKGEITKKEFSAALNAEWDLIEECVNLEAELEELQRVLATGTDPHAAISEGAL